MSDAETKKPEELGIIELHDSILVEIAKHTPALLEPFEPAGASAQLAAEPLIKEVANLKALVSAHNQRHEFSESNYFRKLLTGAEIALDSATLTQKLTKDYADYDKRKAFFAGLVAVANTVAATAVSVVLRKVL